MRECYQDGVKNIEGLGELLGETKDEKSQMYLINNLNNIKNNFSCIYDKYQRYFKRIANDEKNDVNYEILSSTVDNINFYNRYGTLYKYLNDLYNGVENISKWDKSFLNDLLKGFEIKTSFSTIV